MTILLEFKRRTLQGRKTVNLSGCPRVGEERKERTKRRGERDGEKKIKSVLTQRGGQNQPPSWRLAL